MSVGDGVSSDGLDFAIQVSMRAGACWGRDCERIGPFLATFNRSDDNPFLNYAIPDSGTRPSSAEVKALVAAYRARDRRPRLEYIPALAPAVEPVLLTEGFSVEDRLPLMTCAAASQVQEVIVAGIELVGPASEDEFRAVASVQWEAYEEQGDVPQRAVDALRRTVEAGGSVVLARDVKTQQPAGAGLCTAPHDGLTELSSVGVRRPFRRRGIAAMMASRLAREAFEKGATGVFLMAHSEGEAARVYARTGFLSQSQVLHISRS